MTSNKLSFKNDALTQLARGADKLSQAVVSTLGPRSRNVAINREYNGPMVMHDGVTVARSIRLKDPFEDMGVMMLREAASKTNDLAGDGTTTATLLANTLIQEGLKVLNGVSMEGFTGQKVNPMQLKEQLGEFATTILKKIEKFTVPATERSIYEHVATVSSGFADIGKLVADAIEKVGNDGIVMVEQSGSAETTLEFQEGMEFDNGWLSPYFVTDANRMIAEYGTAYVLICNHRIGDPHELVNIVEKVNKAGGRPLLIIADTVQGFALQWLVNTQKKHVQAVMAVDAPEFGPRRKEMLEDIAILTGGNLIDADLGKKVSEAEIADLGRLRSFRVTETHTRIMPENPDSEEIKERIIALREQIDAETNPMIKQKLEMRLGKLTHGVAIINVGAPSVLEMQERAERVNDAVYATKAAISEGIIPGAGMTLYRIADEIEVETITDKRNAAYDLIQKMLRAPFETIMRNSGFDPEEIIKKIEKRQEQGKEMIGFDVIDEKTHPLLTVGIIDPAKVTRLAVSHAISVAATILTTETLITEEKDDVQRMELIQR